LKSTCKRSKRGSCQVDAARLTPAGRRGRQLRKTSQAAQKWIDGIQVSGEKGVTKKKKPLSKTAGKRIGSRRRTYTFQERHLKRGGYVTKKRSGRKPDLIRQPGAGY